MKYILVIIIALMYVATVSFISYETGYANGELQPAGLPRGDAGHLAL